MAYPHCIGAGGYLREPYHKKQLPNYLKLKVIFFMARSMH